MEIKVLGPGCSKCKKLEQITKDAVNELGIEANIEKIEDLQMIIEYGVMRTPALVVNNEVVLSGRLASRSQIKEILLK